MWIYLDLSDSVAIVRNAPAAASEVNEDVELKKGLDYFLGVERRQLYSPLKMEEVSEEQGTGEFQSEEQISATFDDLHLSQLNLFWQKILFVKQISLKQQMQKELNQQPDLSELPDKRNRDSICNTHKDLVEKILGQEQSLHCLSFLDSLSANSPIDVCHPLAIGYRSKQFAKYKVGLAKIMFKLLNHTIFYCGLRQYLEWQQLNNCNSVCVLGIGSLCKRYARYRLSKSINDPNVLLQTLVHEMCHAAAFVFNGETAHGDNTRKWANRAKLLLPQLPPVAVCPPRYSYFCPLCRRSALSNVDFNAKRYQLHCFHCQFELQLAEISEGLPVPHVTPYMLFVRANYSQCDEIGHSAKMHELNSKYLRKSTMI